MSRLFFKVYLLLSLACSGLAFAGAAESTANLEDGVILKGYDAVSYFHDAKPVKGSAQFKTERQGATYWFVSDANRQEFLKSPEKYAPAYEGWCATAVAKGSKFDIDPESYKITDGRLFLFYKGWRGDAKKEWVEDEPKSIKTADKNWPEVQKSKP